MSCEYLCEFLKKFEAVASNTCMNNVNTSKDKSRLIYYIYTTRGLITVHTWQILSRIFRSPHYTPSVASSGWLQPGRRSAGASRAGAAEVPDPQRTGQQLMIEGRVLGLSRLQLLGEKTKGLPMDGTRAVLMQAGPDMRRRSIHIETQNSPR